MLVLAILLLLAAVGLLAAAIVTGQTVLAWGSVGLSALVVLSLLALGRRARRRRRLAAEADPDAALDDEHDLVDPYFSPTLAAPAAADRIEAAEPGGDPDTDPGTAVTDAGDPVTGTGDPGPGDPVTGTGDPEAGDPEPGDTDTDPDDTEPDEEDTDAADLLVVWELPDEVLVVDEHPRYHLARCTWPDAAAAERLPVQEARELGFTPCAQCRPDATLARRYRAALARQGTVKPDDAGTGREPDRETGQDASSGGQDSDNSAVLG